MRRPGAASLDLSWVACGRLDGFWEFGLSPWDMAAGALIITEAGGLVSDLAREAAYLDSGNLVAGNPKVFAQLLQVIQSHWDTCTELLGGRDCFRRLRCGPGVPVPVAAASAKDRSYW